MKNTRFSVFVAALLCVVIALSSCTGSAVLPSDDELANDRTNEGAIVPIEDEGAGEGDENLSEIDTTTTNGKIAVWKKYLGYKASVSDVAEKTSGKNLYTDEYEYTDINNFGLVMRSYYDDAEITMGVNAGKLRVSQSFAVYNPFVKQDALKSYYYDYVADSDTKAPVQEVTRHYVQVKNYGVFVVEHESWVAIYEELPENATQAPEILRYEIDKVTYDIFLCDGTPIAEGVESAGLRYSRVSGRYAVLYDGYAYLLDNQGHFITKMAEELVYNDPILRNYESNGLMKIGAYYVAECGDGLGFFNEKGLLVSVLKAKDVYDVDNVIVLPDGRILMQAFNGDYNNPEVNTTVFDPATGKISAVEFGYIIEDFVDETIDGMTVAEGFVFVEGYAIENGVAATEKAYLVLKADLSVEATLPEIVMNQCGAIQFVDSDTFLIPASIGNDVYAYRVVYDETYYGINYDFYAFDFEIENFYDGMLLVTDNDGKRNLIDMNGTIIVSDVRNVQTVQSSVLVTTYDEEYGYSRYTLCYYDKDYDRVESEFIFSTGEYTWDYDVYTMMEGKFIVVDYSSHNSYYESVYNYREYYNVEGEKVYSFSYTSQRYDGKYVYRASSGSSRTTIYEEIDFASHDAIVLKVTFEDYYNSEDDYIRYDIIK